MKLFHPFALAVLAVAACQTPQPEDTLVDLPACAGESSTVLPTPREPLAVPDAGEPVRLAALVADYMRILGADSVVPASTRALLEQTTVEVQPGQVAPEDVHAFIGALLQPRGIFLALHKGGGRPILGLYTSADLPDVVPVDIPPDRLLEASESPALWVQTLVRLHNCDARALQTQLRAMIKDTRAQAMLSLGPSSLWIQGAEQWVRSLVSTLRRLDAGEAPASR